MSRHKTDDAERRFQMEFGLRVSMARDMRDLTQAQLAKILGLSRATIANIEGGRQSVDFYLVARLTKALRLRITKLLPTLYLQ